jgi:hypothetical protein
MYERCLGHPVQRRLDPGATCYTSACLLVAFSVNQLSAVLIITFLISRYVLSALCLYPLRRSLSYATPLLCPSLDVAFATTSLITHPRFLPFLPSFFPPFPFLFSLFFFLSPLPTKEAEVQESIPLSVNEFIYHAVFNDE